MTQNLLVQRFKSAKRELTALKTLHQRGVGLVNIYKETVTLTSSSTGIKDITITVNCSQDFAAYPFIYILGYGENITGRYYFAVETTSVNYVNNGFTAVFEGTGTYFPDYIIPKFEVYATSPITSINYTWS